LSNWALVFLGIIALGSLVQIAVLWLLAIEGRRVSAKIDALALRFEKDLRPSLEGLARISRNLAEISDLGVVQARRIDEALADTLDKVQEVTDSLRRVVIRPLGPLSEVAAFFRGVKRGIEVYQQLRRHDRRSRRPGRPYSSSDSEDEHMFI